jgi:hypothetical protein
MRTGQMQTEQIQTEQMAKEKRVETSAEGACVSRTALD